MKVKNLLYVLIFFFILGYINTHITDFALISIQNKENLIQYPNKSNLENYKASLAGSGPKINLNLIEFYYNI